MICCDLCIIKIILINNELNKTDVTKLHENIVKLFAFPSIAHRCYARLLYLYFIFNDIDSSKEGQLK